MGEQAVHGVRGVLPLAARRPLLIQRAAVLARGQTRLHLGCHEVQRRLLRRSARRLARNL